MSGCAPQQSVVGSRSPTRASSTDMNLAFGGAFVGFVFGSALSARESSLLSSTPFLSVSNCSKTDLPQLWMAA